MSVILMLQISDYAAPFYLRNIVTAKEDGQTNKILSGEM